jgi:hypothetical protein
MASDAASDAGGTDRRVSGREPEPGAGGTDGRVAGGGAGTLGRSPSCDGERDVGGPADPRGVVSGARLARVGGGTNARRAIHSYASVEPTASLLRR